MNPQQYSLRKIGFFLMIFLVSVTFSFFFSRIFGEQYAKFVPAPGGGLVPIELPGLIIAYTFFASFFFVLFWQGNRYLATGIALVPALLIQVTDIQHFYIPVTLVVVGFGIGYGIRMVWESIYKTS